MANMDQLSICSFFFNVKNTRKVLVVEMKFVLCTVSYEEASS